MPRPSDAKALPAHDEHPMEKLTIAVDPYDSDQKAALFSTRFLDRGLLPMLFVVSNGGEQPVLLTGIRVQLVLRDRSKFSPADEDDLYRRLSTTPHNDSGVTPLPIPIPRKPKAGAPKETAAELQASRFHADEVAPGTTQSGFLFFEVGQQRASLAGAHLYVTGVRQGGNELMYFEIALDKYLAASQQPARQ